VSGSNRYRGFAHQSRGSTTFMTATADQCSAGEGVPAPFVPRSRRWYQLRLADLAVWVLGWAIALELCRRWFAHWGSAPSPLRAFDRRFLALAVLLLPVALALRLGRQVIRLARGRDRLGRSAPASDQGTGAAGIAWRLAALSALSGVTAALAGILGPPPSPVSVAAPFPAQVAVQESVFPLSGLFVLLGLLAGMRPAAPPSTDRGRSSVLFPLIAAVASVGIVAAYMGVPYLVLVALDVYTAAMPTPAAVANAMSHQLGPRPPGLAIRVERAAIEAGAALAVALLTAGWLSRDLRRAASGVEEPPCSTSCIFWRLATFGAMIALAGWVIWRTIPAIDHLLSQGVWRVVGLDECLAIVVALAGLSAGITARAIGRRDAPAPVPQRAALRLRALGRLVLGLFSLALIAAAASKSWMMGAEAAIVRARAPDAVRQAMAWLVKLDAMGWPLEFCDWLLTQVDLGAPPVLWLPAVVWAAFETVRVCAAKAPDCITSFDAVVVDRRKTVRFLALWAALTTLCVCAIPVLFVAALYVYQFRLMRLD
jgi:hypothetical protein